MNLKEFFKPRLNKIILFILIFLFAPLPVYVANPVCPQAIGYECKPYWGFVPFILFGLGGFASSSSSGLFFSFGFIGEFWPYLLINLVISYLISCLIIWIYNKIKKK